MDAGIGRSYQIFDIRKGEGVAPCNHFYKLHLSIILLRSFLAGGLAGIGGLSIVSGIIGRLRPGASPSYGYVAIIVTALKCLKRGIIVTVRIFFGGLLTAGRALWMSMENKEKLCMDFLPTLLTLYSENVEDELSPISGRSLNCFPLIVPLNSPR